MVAALVALALALRLAGLDFLLPHSITPDSRVYHDEVEVLRHDGDRSYRCLEPGLYPHLVPWLVLLWPDAEGGSTPRTLEEHLERASLPWVRVNLVVALLSLIAVPATYLLARRFLERTWSAVASALLATNVLNLWFSQQGRPHSVQASLALLAVLACLRLRRKPTVSSYLLAGAGMALAVGGLQNGLATLSPFAVALLLRARNRPRASPAWALASFTLVGVAFVWFYPFVFEAHELVGPSSLGRLAVENNKFLALGNSVALAFQGGGFRSVGLALWSYDPLLAALAAAGLALALAGLLRRRAAPTPGVEARSSDRDRRAAANQDRRADLWVVLAYMVPYSLVLGLYNVSHQRFAIPLLPYFACLAAYALRGLWRLGREDPRRRPVARIAAALLTACVLVAQAWGAARLSWIRSRPDTATLAASWIRENARPGEDTILVSHPLELPLYQTEAALERNAPMLENDFRVWFAYQRNLPPSVPRPLERYDLVTMPLSTEADRRRAFEDPVGWLKSLKARWVVIELGRRYPWTGLARMREELARSGRQVARFSPDRPDPRDRFGDAPIAHQGYDPSPFPIVWFWRILQARCTGPVIEIWSVDR